MDVVETAPVETPAAPPVDDGGSLADHEAQFGAGAKREPVPARDTAEPGEAATPDRDDTTGQFRKRAASQRGTSKDTDEIAALTKRLREAEGASGLIFERKPGESDRAFALRQRAEIAEALRDAKKAPKAEPAAAPRHEPAAAPRHEPAVAPSTFDKPRPKPQDFANADDPFDAYADALTDWKWDKKIHEAQQLYLAQQQASSQKAAEEYWTQHGQKVQADIDTFKKEHPDYDAKMDAIEDLKLPDVLMEAISTGDNPAKVAYALASNEDELLNLIGFSASLGYSADSVALVRRRLQRHAQAIDAAAMPKGASPPAPAPVLVAPRPPTPLGTGPLKTGTDLPDDDSPLSAHEKAFGPKSRFDRSRR